MGSEVIKILKFIISTTKISNYVFNNSGNRLSILSTMDLLQDPDIAALVQSRSIREYVKQLEIVAQASPYDAAGFLMLYEGREVFKLVLEKSSFAKSGYDINQFLDETTEMITKMG